MHIQKKLNLYSKLFIAAIASGDNPVMAQGKARDALERLISDLHNLEHPNETLDSPQLP
jgi:hypothetical protein